MTNTGRFEKGQIPWNKDKPFMVGKDNPMYGKHHTEATKEKIRLTRKLKRSLYKVKSGKEHWNWKGDNVKYFGVHHWIHKLEKPELCSQCGKNPGYTKAGHTKLHWANISGQYKRDLTDWKVLCISCHWKFDKRINNFNKNKPVLK